MDLPVQRGRLKAFPTRQIFRKNDSLEPFSLHYQYYADPPIPAPNRCVAFSLIACWFRVRPGTLANSGGHLKDPAGF